ncbi:hypothetical protein HJG60_010408 [Phyllostomus discolor]|uniref:Uncharacterized protein n=1 Tax=Phyllostomus discolor TaxID=89673 RepID=A0A834EMY5_9CHIR|nr:hypothetical protein HJG60_010408 [Phyllostomus discolor]
MLHTGTHVETCIQVRPALCRWRTERAGGWCPTEGQWTREAQGGSRNLRVGGGRGRCCTSTPEAGGQELTNPHPPPPVASGPSEDQTKPTRPAEGGLPSWVLQFKPTSSSSHRRDVWSGSSVARASWHTT